MRKLILLIAVGLVSAVQAETTVAIEELGQADYETLHHADEEYDSARNQVLVAQKREEEARKKRAEAYGRIMAKYGQTKQPDGCTSGERFHSTQVEIRGKYVILSDGDQECYSSGGFFSF